MSRPTPESLVAFDSNRLTEAWPKLTVADPQASKVTFQKTYAKVLRGAFDKKSSCQGLYARTSYFAASRFEGIATDTSPFHYCGIHASCHIYGTMKYSKSGTSRICDHLAKQAHDVHPQKKQTSYVCGPVFLAYSSALLRSS